LKISIRRFRIQISTLRGTFGVDIPFDRGLVVIRAENTSGKSTCVQAIIYALGLEAMLTAQMQTPPLQYAVLDRFKFQDGEVRVDESEVFLELENSAGEIITIQRTIISATRKGNLVTIWRGPLLSDTSGSYEKQDYFVRIEGAAQRPLGFHSELAKFVGWTLPTVHRFDGSPCPLYLECIFPLFIIEQKHGWSGIQARMPTHFRIREMGKRAIEFVLNLDSYAIAEARQELRQRTESVLSRWVSLTKGLSVSLIGTSAIVKDLPSAPIESWPPVPLPRLLISNGTTWETVRGVIDQDTVRLKSMGAVEVPVVSEVSEKVSAQLRQTEQELVNTEIVATKLFRDTDVEMAQNESIRQRLMALREDLQHFQDLKRLHDIGSDLNLHVATGKCPTCGQAVNDALLPQDVIQRSMSLEENISFIEGQIRTFDAMLADSDRVLDARQRRLNALRLKVDELRRDIRAQKRTLISDGRSASAADVREYMNVENRLKMAQSLEAQFREVLANLEALSVEWAEVKRLERLQAEDLSEEDKKKLASLETSLTNQLAQYGFSSIEPGAVKISPENYRPTYEGFDLGFNLSASDMIRTIWAYLYGLLEVDREEKQTNHLGLLLLDEPRQQQADKVSFAEFAKRASDASKFSQQVIFMTSEDESTVQAMLQSAKYQYRSFSGKMIQPLERLEVKG
jgi:hypothetical protein